MESKTKKSKLRATRRKQGQRDLFVECERRGGSGSGKSEEKWAVIEKTVGPTWMVMCPTSVGGRKRARPIENSCTFSFALFALFFLSQISVFHIFFLYQKRVAVITWVLTKKKKNYY